MKGIRYAMRTANVLDNNVLVVWDGGRAPMRVALYPEYKANRQQPQTDVDKVEETVFYEQIEQLQSILPAAGLKSVKYRYVEADDVISVASFMTQDQVVIFSGDKDFHQLASSRISFFDREKGLLSCDDILAFWEVPRVDMILQMRVMIGDSVDNIHGVPRIGVKTALKIVLEGAGKWESTLKEYAGVIARNTILMRLPRTIEDSMVPYEFRDKVMLDLNTPTVGDLRKFAKYCAEFELQEVLHVWG